MTQVRWQIPDEEMLTSGNLACPGCGERIAIRCVLKALGPRTVMVKPAGCSGVADGGFPHSAALVPVLRMAFAAAASGAAGVKAALAAKGEDDVTVLAWAGDGGTLDIGFQALSAAAERNDDVLYACYDNEAYMNTGIQRSSATPLGAWTSTTPAGARKTEPKKNLIAIIAAHGVPYAATATIAFPDDLMRKVVRAKGIRGFKCLHILAPCPPGWRCPAELSVKVARLAVQTGVFPLYEVLDGEQYTINQPPPHLPVTTYLELQGRFKDLSPDEVRAVQANVDRQLRKLVTKHGDAHP